MGIDVLLGKLNEWVALQIDVMEFNHFIMTQSSH